VLAGDNWKRLAAEHGLDAGTDYNVQSKQAETIVLKRIAAQLRDFPGYAQVRRATLMLEPWTIDNGLLTPTMKLKRAKVMEKFNAEIDRMYAGH
jgi:long-chain acyl-CoA synthetase